MIDQDEMMRTGQILATTMTMTTVRVRRTRQTVRKEWGKGRGQRMGRWKGMGKGREMVKGKVLLNCMRKTWTQRAD